MFSTSSRVSARRSCRSSRPRGGVPRILLLLLILSSSSLVLLIEAQEAPNADLQLESFTFPDNNPTRTFRTNFCDAASRIAAYNSNNLHRRDDNIFDNDGEQHNATLTLERVLEGVQLRVALYPNFNGYALFEEDENGRPLRLRSDYPGLIPQMLDAICNRAGCTWRDSYVTVPRTLEPNQTFTDLVAWTTDVYDVSAMFWLRSIARLHVGITFTESWNDGSIIMIAPRAPPGEEIFDPWGWLAPFDRAVWITIVATLLFSTLVHWLIEVVFNVQDDSEDGDDESQLQHWWGRLNPWESLWRFATAFAGQFEFEPTSGPAYLFTFSVAFWALLMGASYTANLASFLVIRNRAPLPVNTVEEAIAQNQKICVRRGSLLEDIMVRRFPQYAGSEKLVRVPNQPLEGLQPDRQLCDIALVTAGVWDVQQRNAQFNGQCNLEWIGRPLTNVPGSFGIKSDVTSHCTSLLRDALNVHLLELEADGVRNALWQQHVDRHATVDCSSGAPPSSAAAAQKQKEGQNSSRRLAQLQRYHDNFYHEEEAISFDQNDDNDESFDEARHRLLRASLRRVGVDPAVVGGSATSSKLSLTNMGGVFLLHGILSMLAVVCAAVTWMRSGPRNNSKMTTCGSSSWGSCGNHTNNKIAGDIMVPTTTTAPTEHSASVYGGFSNVPTPDEKQESAFGNHHHRHYHDKHDIRRSMKRDMRRSMKDMQHHQQHCSHNNHSSLLAAAGLVVEDHHFPASNNNDPLVQQEVEIHTVANLKALKVEMMARLDTAFEEHLRTLVLQPSITNKDQAILGGESEIMVPRSVQLPSPGSREHEAPPDPSSCSLGVTTTTCDSAPDQ